MSTASKQTQTYKSSAQRQMKTEDSTDEITQENEEISTHSTLKRSPSPPPQEMSRWTLRRLERLSPHEHDFQEFKSSEWLVRGELEIQSDFHFALSKQVSAFVNGSGGALFIGINDDGVVDDGVPTQLKGGGTRAWLEDMIATSVTPSVAQFNVYEVAHTPSSPEALERATYVIELPSSTDAPHQSKDHRYYLRIAGKSRPMSHLHVEDVLRRNSLPQLTLARLGPYGEVERDDQDPRGPRSFVMLRAFIHNQGRTMARHVGVELTLPRPFMSGETRERMSELGETHYTQRPSEVSFFRYHPTPLFPTQEVYGLCLWVGLHQNNLSQLHAGAALTWAVYADDAKPVKGSIPLVDFSSIRQAIEWVELTSSKAREVDGEPTDDQ